MFLLFECETLSVFYVCVNGVDGDKDGKKGYKGIESSTNSNYLATFNSVTNL